MVQLTEEDLAWQSQVLRLESEGMVTRAFRRLDPPRQRGVIEAIIAEASEYGPRGMQVKRVATRAGVAVGSLYRYFPRREGMLEAATGIVAGYLTGSLDGYRPLLATLPLRDGLAAYLSGGVEWGEAHRGLLSFFVRAAYAGEPGYAETLVRPVARSLQGLLRAVIEAAAGRGELRDGTDPEVAIRLVQAITTAVADAELLPHLNGYYLLFDRGFPAERIREATVDFVVRAIGRAAR